MLLSKLHYRKRDIHLWRSLWVMVVAILLLLTQTPTLSAAPLQAGDDGNAGTAVAALDKLCVNGLVINHQEQPQSGWTVTAVYLGTNGAATPQTTVSDSNGEFHFELGLPGLWQFSITLPADWHAVTDATFEVDVTYGLKDCLPIRFKVEQRIEVIICKIDDDHIPLPGWTMIATPGKDNTFTSVYKAVTQEDGCVSLWLPPGHWIFTEQAPDSVEWWAPVIPLGGIQDFVVQAPGPYTIRFKNYVPEKPTGCINVTKLDVPPDTAQGSGATPFGLPDWPIVIKQANGSTWATGNTNVFGNITFRGLPLGPYVVQELVLPGWVATTPTTYAVTLTRNAQDCENIVFQNKQVKKGICIEGEKLDAFRPSKDSELFGIPGWEIDATPLDAGDDPNPVDPAPVLTDGQGKFRIDFPLDDYRVPGSRYQVCETVQDGWTSVTPICQTVTLPKYPGACVVIPPFINHQTNEQHQPPKTDYPQKHHEQNQNEQNHNDGKQQGNRPWQPSYDGGCSTHHTVQRGESIFSIAPKYNTNGAALMRANPWVYSQRNNWVFVGQQVCIP